MVSRLSAQPVQYTMMCDRPYKYRYYFADRPCPVDMEYYSVDRR